MAFRTLQIFRAGTHKTSAGDVIEFSAEVVRRIATLYNMTKLARAPLVVGHPSDSDPTPNAGTVSTLIEKDGDLWAMVDVKPSMIDQVRRGAFNAVSASFHAPGHLKNPFPGAWSLRHVGFLGGSMRPAVKGMAPPEFAETVVEFAESLPPYRASGDPFVDAFNSTEAVGGLLLHERVQFAREALVRR